MSLILRGILLTALASGLAAGIAFFAAQLVTTGPLIARAELHEHAEQHATSPAHSHDAGEWEPGEGIERTSYTLAADVIIGIGYAFLLVGAVRLSARPVTLRSGLAWGAAGFLVFVAAPALGLQPEPPGGRPADLLARQTWWLLTAGATAFGLWLILLQPRSRLRAVGVLLLVAPHLIGAPQPMEAVSEVHASLSSSFVWAALTANAILWMVLGLGVCWLYPKLNRVVPS